MVVVFMVKLGAKESKKV